MARTRGRARSSRALSPRAKRRAEARARAKARAKRVPLRRRLPRPLRSAAFWVALLLAAAVTGGGTYWSRTRAVALPAEPTPVPGEAVTSYRVVYHMHDTADPGGKVIDTTELLEVRRPYSSLVETREGKPPGGAVLSGSIANRDFFWTLRKDGEVQFAIRRQPGTAHRDTSYAILEDAVAAGLGERGESRRVLGHQCTVFVFKEPRPQPLEPPAGDSVESCVTRDGVLLEDRWRLKGRLVQRRTAVEVDTNATIPDEHFRIGVEPDPDAEANRVILESQRVVEDEQPEGVVRKPELPDGFEPDRRANHFESGGGQAPPRNTYYLSYRRGNEVVVLDQGSVRGPLPRWKQDEGAPIRIDREWDGRLVYVHEHVEVRVWRPGTGELPETPFLRVQAPTRDLAVWFAKTAL